MADVTADRVCCRCTHWERASEVLPFRCGNVDSPAIFIVTPPMWGCRDFAPKPKRPKRPTFEAYNLKGYVRMAPIKTIVALALVVPALAGAQSIPPPTGPVTFCGTQAAPAATAYTVSVDGGAAAPLTMTAPPASACPSGATHSFTLPASIFTVGTHRVVVTAANSFGSTAGPEYQVVVGIRPGQFTVTAVVPPGN
jgi:hypothetical protein